MTIERGPKIIFYDVFPTSAGWMAALATAAGLAAIVLPQKTGALACRALGDKVTGAERAPERFEDLAGRFRLYFNGHQADFRDKLDIPGATPFQRGVWNAARLIPYGQTRSYQWVAIQIGRPGAARAVGRALGKNPLPIIIPCHRVIAADGGPGGYRGGMEMKRRLLGLERAGLLRFWPV